MDSSIEVAQIVNQSPPPYSSFRFIDTLNETWNLLLKYLYGNKSI